MSSREQLKEYVNALKRQIRELQEKDKRMDISLKNLQRCYDIKDLELKNTKIDLRKRIERITKLEDKLRKVKHWWQIII